MVSAGGRPGSDSGHMANNSLLYARIGLAEQADQILHITDAVRSFGFEPESFLDGTHSWQDIVYFEDLPEVSTQLRNHLHNGARSFRLTYRAVGQGGILLRAEDFRSVCYDDAGTALYMEAAIFTAAHRDNLPGAESGALSRGRIVDRLLVRALTSQSETPFLSFLQDCGESLGYDRISYLALNRQKEIAQMSAQWCAPGSPKRPTFDILVRGFPEDLYDTLREDGIVCFQEEELRRLLQGMFHDNNTRSAAITLVRNEQTTIGMMLFETLRKPRLWDDESVDLVRGISEVAHHAIHRELEQQYYRDNMRAGQTVLDNLPAFVYVTEPETNELVYANRLFKEEFGDECIGKPCWLSVWGGMSHHCIECINTKTDGKPIYREVHMEHRAKWLGATLRDVRWLDGREVRIITCVDITKEKTSLEMAEQSSCTDVLTGLPNRTQCDRDVADAIGQAQETGKIGYVAFIDMDDFKVINEGYGFEYGDAVLIEFAQFLTDNFTPKHRVYRTGGDEFAILLDSANSDDVQNIAQLLLDRSRKPWRPLGKLVYVTVSLGLVQYPGELSNPRDVIRNADLALHQAKRAGKNSFAFFNRTEGKNAVARVEMERLLRDAIADHFAGFMPYFQPIVHLQSNRVGGAEALLRWRSETGKMIMPGDFIPLTEYLGLIIPIGEFVLEESARVCRMINENYRADFSMNINVSMRQLMLEDFTERVERILSRTGVNYKNIVLEITEGIAVEDLDRLCKICDTLHEKGLRFAMDDFGTGYSSLSNLRVIPLDSIKIDKSFIRDVSRGSYANSFIHLITDLGHSMNRTICMEGVETEEQLGYCIMTGVDLVQGYYYSPPVPQDQFVEVLSKPLA